MQLTDQQFINQFEDLSLDSTHFNHKGHLRICWLYLNKYDLQTAIEKTCTGIQSYATSLGAKDKFHRTITEFLVRLINTRLSRQSNQSFDIFLQQNQDLLDDAQHLLSQHYSKSLLASVSSRQNYIEPDLIQVSL